MSPAADRNLLFGILALQMDFITREQLVAAMNTWVLRKATPLGEILVAQDALDADHRAWLEAGVERHLAKHGNDPRQSLAALSSVDSARQDLAQLGDDEVQASLGHLPPSHLAGSEPDPHPADPIATRSHSVGESSSSGQRFRLLRLYAEGGLGKVSVALDEELHREVALKEIKEKHADDPRSRGRFLREAEITGGLEHPGIVPVYGLGSYADGRPFYAMRLIRGDSLQEALDRFHQSERRASSDRRASSRKADEAADATTHVALTPRRSPEFASLEFRKLLGRFIDVCNAIAYAHSRGVLHRDLKPGNIMLGKYGETLVVDWGLAKAGVRSQGSGISQKPGEPGASATGDAPHAPLPSPLDELPLTPSGSDHAATIAGSALGTPSYMSPEQAAGRLDLLSPASDVYSLGATLYHLLTGERPLKDLPAGDVLRRVEKGNIPRPRDVCTAVPRPLEAVCVKAMSFSPGDRYATPRDLADDIEHWLADEAVSAWPEPVSLRVCRWARRHKYIVTVTSVLFMFGIGATIVVQEVSKRRDEAEKNLAFVGVNELLRADAAEFPAMLSKLAGQSPWLRTRLRELRRDEFLTPLARTRIELALIEDEPEVVVSLRDRLLTAEPAEAKLIWNTLGQHQQQDQLIEFLVEILEPKRQLTDREFIAMASKQASAGVFLMRLGQADRVWSYFKSSANETLRTYLIHRGRDLNLAPEALLAGIRTRIQQTDHEGASILQGIILALGQYDFRDNSALFRAKVQPTIEKIFKQHPDCGVHSAAEWLLRKHGEVPVLETSKYGEDKTGNRRWFVNSAGQTFAIITPRERFCMGSLTTEAGHEPNAVETRHPKEIYSFAISTTEVTVAQFRKLCKYHGVPAESPDQQCPMTGKSWIHAVEYCRRLSDDEHFPDHEMCFPPPSELLSGTKWTDIDLNRSGYRLPTEAEWEYACRSGTKTARHFGIVGGDLLASYCWYARNANDRSHPIATKMPNGLGLFDMHGNAMEWCLDQFQQWLDPPPVEDVRTIEVNDGLRVLRGGGFFNFAPDLRSAKRFRDSPNSINTMNGFRIVRTHREK